MLLKREIGPESWAVEAVVGAVFKRRGDASLGMGRGFKSAANRLEFRFERKLQNRPRSSRDRPRSTTIERRSCSRFFENAAQQSWNRFHNTWSVIAARSRRNRGSMGPRSWGSSTIRRSRPISDYRDEDPALSSLHAASLETVRSRSCDLKLMKISPPHVATWRSVSLPIDVT